jgi:predicted nucleotidyltransferase
MDTTLLRRDTPEQAVAALREGLGKRLVAVVLFGSRARGDANPESDWDLLILAEGLPENLLERHLFVSRLLPSKLPAAISAVAKSPREFEASLTSLYLDIALDGRILFDPLAYAADRLASLRRLLAEAGLYRERTEAGDQWRWQREPTGAWSLEWKR